jgi:hypothetical protein
LWLVTSIVAGTVVVTLGAGCERLGSLTWPPCTSMGVVVSTPENATIPPTAPVAKEKLQP